MDTGIKFAIPMILLVSAGMVACSDDPIQPVDPETVEEHFGFEADLQGWAPVAIDTLDPPIEWHVRQTSDRGYVGDGSVEIHLENLNDAGKVWMERAFSLVPGVSYTAEITYALGTSDWGIVNLFTIITGVHDDPPRTPEELTFQEETGHGGDQDVGNVWLQKSYTFEVEAPADGEVHVAVGVWGTWETARTYFVDALTVRFVPVVEEVE